MSNQISRHLAALCAVVIFASAAVFPVFAENSAASTSSAVSSSAPSKNVTPEKPPSQTSATGVGHESVSSNVTVVFNLNGGSGMKTSTSVTKGSTVSQFKTPVRKGYTFAGWSMNGTEVSSSMAIENDITLKAEWDKVVSSEPSRRQVASTDTHQAAIDQAAANAKDAAGSDPGALSSQDWSALLASSQEPGSVSSLSSSASSEIPTDSGGISVLLIVGIVLIVLGVSGVGVFIYLQFIRKSGGKGGPGGSGGVSDDTAVFTDISSYSDGKRHDGAETLKQAAVEASRVPSVPKQQQPKNSQPTHFSQPSEAVHPKAQAQPVSGEQSDFDWEKFFNENK